MKTTEQILEHIDEIILEIKQSLNDCDEEGESLDALEGELGMLEYLKQFIEADDEK